MSCKPTYTANPDRYADGNMNYRQCGYSGIRLPEISLGFWWHFGGVNAYEDAKAKVLYAFDHGITCFDLANNYGPPYGSAEETFGRIFNENLRNHRHEMIVTSKAGYDMWPGPYGIGSSRKMLMTSLDESLHRMNLDYVDIFYSHRYDGFTPIEETMQALIDIVHSGKALYVGLSNYPTDKLALAAEYLANQHVHPLIYQGRYNMLVRNVEEKHVPLLTKLGIGFTAFSPFLFITFISKPLFRNSLIFAVSLSYIARKKICIFLLISEDKLSVTLTNVISSIPSPSDVGTVAFLITSPFSDKSSNSATSSLLVEILSC